MGAAVEVTRLELSAAELRREASQCDDGRVACRLLAIAHVLDGASLTDAAQVRGMDRQTLRNWVHRYNTGGVAALADEKRTGRPGMLSAEQLAELKALALAGPNVAIHGVVRWFCVDLQAVIAERFKVVLHERTVGKLLRRVGLFRMQPRPRNPKRDLDAQEAFKKLRHACSRGAAAASSRQTG